MFQNHSFQKNLDLRTQSSITNFNTPLAGFIIGIAWLDISQNDAKSR